MSIQSQIRIKDFLKEYKNKTIYINDLVISKRVTLLLGANGSGKSTLLKGIAGLIDYNGRISSCNVSYMSENPRFPLDITVTQFLDKIYQLENNDYDYHGFLQLFSLETKSYELISSLSKGMKAKLNLIQSLLIDRTYYLLDEPLSGLDEESIEMLLDIIRNSDKSFIISSHIDSTFRSLDCEVVFIDQLD